MLELLTTLTGAMLAAIAVLYLRGWLRLRRRGAGFASLARLGVFGFATLTVAGVFLTPMNWLNQDYLFVRVAQYVFFCLLAAPAFFIACTFDVTPWGLPSAARRRFRRWTREPHGMPQLLRRATQPWLTVLFFLSIFVIWNDVRVVDWTLAHPALHMALLLALGAAAMLVWWHIVGTGPRLHTEFSPWLAAVALLLMELTNMVTGVTIAFAQEPIYAHYAAALQESTRWLPLTAADDQALGGGLLWVVGSAVYVSSVVLVLNRLFERHRADRPEPLPQWDDDERMIMPGLEHRLRK